MPKIEIKITDDGIKVDAIGFTGNKCMTATEFIKKLGTVESVNKKPEFYQQKCEIKTTDIYDGGDE
jgi:hypothetical protein